MVYQNEKIRPPFFGAYPFSYHTKRFAYGLHQKLILCLTITSKGRDCVVKPTGYLCTFSHVTIAYTYYVIYTFKCTGKPSSICMAPRGDNNEGAFFKQPYVLHSIQFQNVCLCMSMYVVELFTRAFSTMKGHTSGLAQSQFQLFYKLHSRFLRFRKFRLVISSTRGVMFNSFKPCFNFVGRWQTVQTQIRRHITTLALDQVFRCCSLKFE